MDVALDTNGFLSDPRMDGVRFQSLLAYLRKTSSGLIITKVVWDEVVARYPDRLSDPYRKAVASVRALRSLVLAAKVPAIPELTFDLEIAALKRKLKRPSNHVRSKILTNFSDVTVEEVARRGIERVPPASPKGEELRDVITWLMIVGYAKKSNRELAFISRDEHFREGETLHPMLRKDIEDAKVRLHFYGSIDDFIKAHAPAPRELNEQEAYSFAGRQLALDLFEIEARKFFPRYWGSAVVEVSHREVQFTKGALYDVGGGSHYGEVEFGGRLGVTVSRTEYLQSVQNVSVFDPYAAGGAVTGMAFGFPGVFGAPASQTRTLGAPPVAPTRLNFLANQVPASSMTYAPTFYTSASEAFLSGKMGLSMRIVSNRMTKVEVETFEVTNVTSTDPLPSPSHSADEARTASD